MAAPAISCSQLVARLRALGLREGSVVLVHARMSALGWVVGGSGAVVSALLEALGPDGTLMALRLLAGARLPRERVAGRAPRRLRRRAAGVRPGHGGGRARPRTDPGARAHVARRRAQRAPRSEHGRGRPTRAHAHRPPSAAGRLRPGQPARAPRRGGRRRADARRAARDAHDPAPRGSDRLRTGQAHGHVRDPGAHGRWRRRPPYTDIDTSRGAYRYEDLDLPFEDE